MKALTVWTLPRLSQEFNEGPVLKQGPGGLAIAYDFETETGEYDWAELRSFGVVAFAYTAASHCTAEQIGAYNKLQQVLESASGFRHAPAHRLTAVIANDVSGQPATASQNVRSTYGYNAAGEPVSYCPPASVFEPGGVTNLWFHMVGE